MKSNQLIQILIVLSFAGMLLPTFAGIPKVPHFSVFVFITLIVAFLLDYRYLLQPGNKIIILLLSLHFIFLIFGWYNEEENKTLLSFVLPIAFLNFLNRFYSFPYNKKRLLWIIKFTCYAFLLTSITTIFSLTVYPDAARMMAGSLAKEGNLELNNFYLLIGIGSYTFTIAWALLIPVYVYIIIQSKKFFIPKVILIGSLPLFFYAIYKVSITTSLVIMALGLLYFLFFRKIKSQNFYFFRLGSIILILFLITSTLSTILYFAADVLNSENISPRLNNIAMRFDGSITTTKYENISDRELESEDLFLGSYQIRANKSIEAFKDNPLIGGGDVGGHHFYLDALGSWGIIGSFLIFYYILNSYYKWQNILDREKFIFYTHIFVVFVFLGLMKTYITLEFFILMYFIIPNIIMISKERRIINHKL